MNKTIGVTLKAHLNVIMPTSKRRLNLSLPENIEISLFKISKSEKVPMATKALELLEEALEAHEDRYFDELATKRAKKSKRLLTHEQAWK